MTTVSKEKLLYLMHVPWGFIKQRPHFVGEYLNDLFDVSIYCLRHTSTRKLASNEQPAAVDLHTLWVSNLPKAVNRALVKFRLRRAVRESRYVWVTYPKMYDFVKDYLTKDHVVVYDCMDDALEFPGVKKNRKKRDELEVLERELCARCDLIFASAEHLKKTLLERYRVAAPIEVVNNGIHLKDRDGAPVELPAPVQQAFRSQRLKLVYIGTIAEWIDFDLILQSLQKFDDIEYIFVGYLDAQIPAHDRIKHVGSVEHKHVFGIMEQSDVLIMPFLVNDLILGVNPVKVYEYIFSGKPSIIRRYPETEQFREYVLLYETAEEYLKAIDDLREKRYRAMHSFEECTSFAKGCTWECRVSEMAEQLRNHPAAVKR